MSTIQMYINGEEVVCDKNININEEFLNTSNLILNNVYPKSWENDKDYVSRFYYPKDYSSFKLYRDGDLYFAGLLKNSGNISLNPRQPKYASVQILDYKTLLSEGKNFDFVLTNVTVSQAITRVVSEIADYGFVVGTINIINDTTIGAYSTLDKSAYDVLQYLSEISQSRWTTRMVDEDTIAIDFYDPTLLPFADDIEYTSEYFTTNKIMDMTWNYGTRDYRNKQYVISNNTLASINTEQISIANGYSRMFVTDNNIGVIVSITVDGNEATFATNDDKNAGIYADFYYTPGNNQFESNSNNNIYVAGTVIDIVYTALIQGREISSNTGEISRIKNQIGRKGEIARYETRNDIISSEDLLSVANTYIKYKGVPEINLKITTQDVDLFNIGQQVHFNIDLEELATDYMIKSKTTQIIQSKEQTVIFYIYTLTSSYNSETAINYFDNQRRKLNGNISQGKYITRNIDIENDIVIDFNNFSSTDITVIGDNILDCVLDAPLIY